LRHHAICTVLHAGVRSEPREAGDAVYNQAPYKPTFVVYF
jgi:hypothetical protein